MLWSILNYMFLIVLFIYFFFIFLYAMTMFFTVIITNRNVRKEERKFNE